MKRKPRVKLDQKVERDPNDEAILERFLKLAKERQTKLQSTQAFIGQSRFQSYPASRPIGNWEVRVHWETRRAIQAQRLLDNYCFLLLNYDEHYMRNACQRIDYIRGKVKPSFDLGNQEIL